MADLTCLIEKKVGSNSGIVEESTLGCVIPLGVGVPDFGLKGLMVENVPLQVDVGVGVSIFAQIPTVQPVVVILAADRGILVECHLFEGIPVIVPLEVGRGISVNLSPKTAIIDTTELPLVVGLGVGISAAVIIPPAPKSNIVNVTVGTQIDPRFGLMAPKLSDIVIVVPVSPQVGVGVSLGLSTVTAPTPKMLSSIITTKIAVSLGLVSNLLPATLVLCNGGTAVAVSCLMDVTEIVETWALTGNNFNPSVFSGFPFNSYAIYRDREYAAGPDGIYLLQGADDDGQEIHSGVRLITNFGNEKHKRLRSMHLGKCGDDAKVRVGAANGEGIFRPDGDDHRVKISRNLQAQEFVLDIIDFSQLSQMEMVILPLVKR